MSSNGIAIRVRGLGKCYQIYDRPQDRLKQSLVPRLQRLAGFAPAKYFREFWALRGVDFDVKRGETVGIIGRNGSGKSTLLQLICGTLTPTTGDTSVTGRVAALLELGAGFNPEFTGRENVYMNSAILGLASQEVDARIEEINAFAEIGDFIDQPVKTYSSGMFVRLAFSAAIHVDASVLIVDEALAVGDTPFQIKCFAKMNELRARGTTILFVSHDLGTVLSFCDQALYLRQGMQVAFGPVEDVTREYERECIRAQTTPRISIGGPDGEHPKQLFKSVDYGAETERLTAVLRDHRHVFQRNASIGTREGTGAVTIESFVLVRRDTEAAQKIFPDEVIKGCFLLKFNIDFEGDIHVAFHVRDKCGSPILVVRDSYFNETIVAKAGQTILAALDTTLPLRAGDYYCMAGVLLFRKGEKFLNGSFNFHDSEICDVVEHAAYFTALPLAHYAINDPVLSETKLKLAMCNLDFN